MEIKTVCVIGLGLIGGSIAKSLRKVKAIDDIIGIDNDKKTLETALEQGVIDQAYQNIDNSIQNADIVFVCTPANRIASCVMKVAQLVRHDCIITDTGSIKRSITEEIECFPETFTFVGGHPMCGSEKIGYQASENHLFENAYYILTGCNKTTAESIKIMEKIIIEIGGIPVIIDSRKHDFVIGAISHFPHIISAALVNLVRDMDCEDGHMRKLAAGGFRDITRISSSNPEMWKNVILNNKDTIEYILEKFDHLLDNFKQWLKDEQEQQIFEYFEAAKDYRDTFSSRNIGLLNPFNDISVDIEDKPGAIGNIATLLGNSSINIKNINVTNSRESDQGCLRISLQDIESVERAFHILETNGYKCYKI